VANVWHPPEKAMAAGIPDRPHATLISVVGPEGTFASHDASRRVLVVEDEPHIRDLVALHLRLDGWNVDTVGHGDDALRCIQAEPFDLIVLDLMLPGLDGLTILKALRRERLHGDV